MSTRRLQRTSVVDELTAMIRDEILDGRVPVGTPLREHDLSESYGVSRHTLRAALRALAAEGLVRIEPNRGARVAHLTPGEVLGLYELRTALELEATHLALERHNGHLPDTVSAAVHRLTVVCRRARPRWNTVAAAHADIHLSIVAASGAARIEANYEALARELQLFLIQLRPVWSLERMITHHEELLIGLEREGPAALRRHLRDGVDAVLTGLDAEY